VKRPWFVLVPCALVACELVADIHDRSSGSSPGTGGASGAAGTIATGGGGASGGGGAGGGQAGAGGSNVDSGSDASEDGSNDAPGDAPDATVHGALLFQKRFGGANDQSVRDAITDSTGALIVTGVLQGDIDFGGGTLQSAGVNDFFLVKFDATGKYVFSKRFGDSANQWGFNSLAVDASDNIVFAGDFEGTVDFGDGPLTSMGASDIFVAKFDPQGNPIWSKRFGGSGPEYDRSMALDSSGNIFLCAHHDLGTTNLGGSDFVNPDSKADILIAKLNPSGGHVWSKSFTPTTADHAFCSDVELDGNGDVILTGIMEGPLDLGGGPLTHGGYEDAWLAKLSGVDGTHVWSKSFGDTDSQRGRRLALQPDGTIVLAGMNIATNATPAKINLGGATLSSYGGAFLARFTPAGGHIQSTVFEGFTLVQSARVDPSGNVYLCGRVEAPTNLGGGTLPYAGSTDVVVGKWTSDLQHVYSKSFGALADELCDGMGVDSAGNAWITGSFGSIIDFGGGQLTTNGGLDVFIAEFGP
jgi:hypothetical protein